MTVRNVKKNLAGMQDLVQGVGDVTQTRNSQALAIAKVDVPYAVNTVAEMQDLEITQYTRARVYSTTTIFADYIYDAAATSGIASNTGAGYWIRISSSASYAVLQDLVDDVANVNIGDTFYIEERTTGNGGGAHWKVVDATTVTENGFDIVTGDATRSFQLVVGDEANAKAFGAVGGADDTLAIQAAFDYGVDVYVPDGTYMIDAVDPASPTTKYQGGVKPSNNTTIRFAKNAKFKAITNSADEYVILNLDGTENVTIVDGHCVGDVDTHTGSTGEFGFGFYIGSSTDLKLIRCKADKCWGDGFYMGAGELTPTVEPIRTLLSMCDADDNRRQGLSIIACKRALVLGGTFRNTGTTLSAPPAYGIDIEPNPSNEVEINVELIGVETSGNDGGGLQIVPGFMSSASYTNRNYRVKVSDYTSYQDGSTGALRCAFPSLTDPNIVLTNTINGEIVIDGARIVEPVSRGVDFARWIPIAPYVKVKDVSVIDCNTSGGTASTAEQCAFVVEALTSDSAQQSSNGKIDFIRPRAIDTRATPKMLIPMYLHGGTSSQSIDDVVVSDPYGENWSSTANSFVNWNRTTNGLVTYSKPPSFSLSGSTTLAAATGAGELVSMSVSGVITLPAANDSIGIEYLIENPNGVTIQVRPNAADEILVAGNGTGVDAVFRKDSTYMRIKSIGGNKWLPLEMIGEIAPLNTQPTIGQNGIRTNAGSPSGVLTPRYIGENALDTSANQFYKAYGLANTNWKQTTV